QVANVFEADAALVQFAAVLRGDAVEHFGGVEGAHHVARPALALQQPAQQDGVDLVRVHVAAVFGDRANAVGVAIGDEAAVALLAHHRLLRFAHVRLDGLGINAGKQRVHLGANLDKVDAALGEDAGQHSASRAIHAVDEELEAGAGDPVDVGEFLDGGDVGLLEVGLGDRGRASRFGKRSIELLLDGGDDCRTRRAAVTGLVLHSIPVPGIVAGGNHHPAGGVEVLHAE